MRPKPISVLLCAAAIAAIAVGFSAGTGTGAGARAGAAPKAAPAVSPLDPLSAPELKAAIKTIKADPRFPAGASFPIIRLAEPSKDAVLAWSPGAPVTRRAFANVYDAPRNHLYEVVVDLASRTVVSWTRVRGRQPSVSASEFALAQKIIRKDPRWQHAMQIRGLNPKDVFLDVWAPGDQKVPGVKPGTRLVRAISDYRGSLPNVYDRPVEGVIAVVDMNRHTVVSVTDTGVQPVATSTSGVGHRDRGLLKPLIVTQPHGPSFTVHGTEVSWWHWRFRIGYTPREGLVLNQIGWDQNGAVRPIIYRMAFDDIYVPYSIPLSNWNWRTAFDVGEYNIGQYAENLRKNVDVPNNAAFVNEAVASDTGTSIWPLHHAIALYEQDAGSLWDRADPDTLVRDARLARELVVTASYPIGNYTYSVKYVFRMDGGIDVRVGATGTTLNEGVSTNEQGEKYGSMVGPNVAAPAHQHFLNFRIDFDVDGTANRLVEENVHSLHRGNAFVSRETVLGHEQHRDLNASTYRSWLVQSTTHENAYGRPTAYELVPGETTRPYSSPLYPALLRAAMAQHPLWVTDYSPDEQYSVGPYPNEGPAGQGLTKYVADHASVNGRDLVAWYTASFTHLPVPENYPVMSTETLGFNLRPAGFFDQNPALDAP